MNDESSSPAAGRTPLVPAFLEVQSLQEQSFRLPKWLRPADLDTSSVRSWILEVCDKLQTNPSALALKAGLAASTLNRFVSGRGNVRSLNARSLAHVEKVVLNEFFQSPHSSSDADSRNSETYSCDVVGVLGGGWFEKWQQYKINVPMPMSAFDKKIVAYERRRKEGNTTLGPESITVSTYMTLNEFEDISEPVEVTYARFKHSRPHIEAGLYMLDPSGHRWILPHDDFDSLAIPLGRKTGWLFDNMVILGRTILEISFTVRQS